MVIKRGAKKLYPVCGWYKNQHKMYNYNDKMAIAYYDTYGDSEYEALRESERLLSVFNDGVRSDGIVYAEYEDYKKIKDIIGYYDLTH